MSKTPTFDSFEPFSEPLCDAQIEEGAVAVRDLCDRGQLAVVGLVRHLKGEIGRLRAVRENGVIDVLRIARTLLDDPRKWLPDPDYKHAVDVRGSGCDALNPHAVRWSLCGALCRAADDETHLYDGACDAVCSALAIERHVWTTPGTALAQWSSVGRTHGEVLAALAEAVALIEKVTR